MTGWHWIAFGFQLSLFGLWMLVNHLTSNVVAIALLLLLIAAFTCYMGGLLAGEKRVRAFYDRLLERHTARIVTLTAENVSLLGRIERQHHLRRIAQGRWVHYYRARRK